MAYRRFRVAETDLTVRLHRQLNFPNREDVTNMFNECGDRRSRNVLQIYE